MTRTRTATLALFAAAAPLFAMPAAAHGYREQGKPVAVAASTLVVIPNRDWNQLAGKPGKKAERWTLDGEQLDQVTFYGGIAPGEPLLRERDRKHRPLPKLTRETLLAEVPELLEATYRTDRAIASFTLHDARPERFLGTDGIRFAYEYVDDDNLPRRGEAHAALVKGQLYMATLDAPRLHYFDRVAPSYRALIDSATLR
ncbi:MAG: hypothetical protein PGN12_02195 [Sphingomonas phyllosphaerae]